jgi:hypothetical protein
MINPTVSKVFHDIRNTYQVLFTHFGMEEGEEPIFTKEQIMEYLDRDLKLMIAAEEACKDCHGGKNGN